MGGQANEALKRPCAVECVGLASQQEAAESKLGLRPQARGLASSSAGEEDWGGFVPPASCVYVYQHRRIRFLFPPLPLILLGILVSRRLDCSCCSQPASRASAPPHFDPGRHIQPRHPASESATPARAGAAQRNNSHYHHRPSSTTPTHTQPSSAAPLLRAPSTSCPFPQSTRRHLEPERPVNPHLFLPLLHLSSSFTTTFAVSPSRHRPDNFTPLFQLKPGTENFLPAELPSNSSHPRHTIPPRTEKPPSCHPQGAVAPERSLSMYPNSMISRMSLERGAYGVVW